MHILVKTAMIICLSSIKNCENGQGHPSAVDERHTVLSLNGQGDSTENKSG